MHARSAFLTIGILIILTASACAPSATPIPIASGGRSEGASASNSASAGNASPAKDPGAAAGESAQPVNDPGKPSEDERVPMIEAGDEPSAAGSSSAAESSDDFIAPGPNGAAVPGTNNPPKHGILTAGEIDDHLNFTYFRRYALNALARHEEWPAFDLSGRVTLSITDAVKKPFANVRVDISANQAGLKPFSAWTGPDGTLDFFPVFDLGATAETYTVQVYETKHSMTIYKTEVTRQQLEKNGNQLTIRVPFFRASPIEDLDLLLVIDTTSSMGDELRYITSEFTSIVGKVRKAYPKIGMRFGLVLYRDYGEQYLVKSFEFTMSEAKMQKWLWGRSAEGGGDAPEAVVEAFKAALSEPWLYANERYNSARVVIHVTDAPPHPEDYGKYVETIRRFRQAGIRVYPVASSSGAASTSGAASSSGAAASGASDTAQYLMRHEALLTQARYLFLTDDAEVGALHGEPSIPCYQVTRLDQAIERVVLSELAGGRVLPEASEVIRTSGTYEYGVCK